MFLKIILLSLLSTAYADCDRCLGITQNLKNSPRTLHGIFRFLHVFCFFGDRQNCNNYLNETYNYITDTSNDNICYDLGYCQNLIKNNIYIPNGDSRIKVDIYRNENNLMGYNSSLNNNNLNYNLLWNISFNEIIKNVEFKIFQQESIMRKIPNSSQYCFFTNQYYSIYTTFMIVRTKNFIHYFNFTNIDNTASYIHSGKPVYLGNISSEFHNLYNNNGINLITYTREILLNGPHWDLIEVLVNSTVFNVIYPIWDKFKFFTCNNANRLTCCTSEIIGIGSEIYNINFM